MCIDDRTCLSASATHKTISEDQASAANINFLSTLKRGWNIHTGVQMFRHFADTLTNLENEPVSLHSILTAKSVLTWTPSR